MTEPVKNLPPKSIQIPQAKRKELERKCHNNLNWSDGGHWIGSGKEPNCFMKDEAKSTVSHTYKFPTDASAKKWNMEWEKMIRYVGHVGTAALTVGVAAATSGLGGVAAGTLAGIVKDELQAIIPYPRMARGWSFEIIVEHHFKWSPHPWGQRQLSQKTTAISRDFNGKIVKQSSNTKIFKLSELPDGLGRLLGNSPSKKTSSNY